MTLCEIKQTRKDFLSPLDVSKVLRVMPYSLNVQAKTDISRIPFPCFMINSRLKIPRVPFIEWAEKMGLE
ncbi:MAG: hypothetical protein IKQ24_07240 [Verrucomicrobia bacterium]|nr:hypothetical protein [Verrucomicrobiota bacterium]